MKSKENITYDFIGKRLKTGLEIRILTMPVKRKINTTFYCFTAKFSKIHAGQAHFSAGQ